MLPFVAYFETLNITIIIAFASSRVQSEIWGKNNFLSFF